MHITAKVYTTLLYLLFLLHFFPLGRELHGEVDKITAVLGHE